MSRRRMVWFLHFGFACFTCCIFGFFELFADRYVHPEWMFGLWLIFAATTQLKFKEIKSGYLLSIVGVSLILVLHQAEGTPRKKFLLALHSIRNGDQREDVNSKMRRFIELKDTGSADPITDDMQVFRHSDEAQYNGDVGVIYYRGPRVNRVRFFGD